MKRIEIRNTVNSADIQKVKIYHTEEIEDNLLTNELSAIDGTFTGQQLFDGLRFEVEDSFTEFIVVSVTKCTNKGRGIIIEDNLDIQYITFGAGDEGTLHIIGSVEQFTSSTVTIRQDFSTTPSITVTATPFDRYRYIFDGWYTNPDYNGNRISSDNPLTIAPSYSQGYSDGSFSFPNRFYAKWRFIGSYS